jgi:hypothetical protein
MDSDYTVDSCTVDDFVDEDYVVRFPVFVKYAHETRKRFAGYVNPLVDELFQAYDRKLGFIDTCRSKREAELRVASDYNALMLLGATRAPPDGGDF